MTKNNAPSPDQGAFFHVVEEHSGTDPELHSINTKFELDPDGVYLDRTAPARFTTLSPEAQQELDDSVRAANQTTRRHRAQLGKHSPLQQGTTGNYSDELLPGDYLPSFGAVTHTNFMAAKQHAKELDAKKQQP